MNPHEQKNYYDVLEVAPHSTLQDIHNAYLRHKSAYADDSAALYSLMSQEECEKILEQIEEAYSILGVPEKRREYDQAKGLNQTHTPEGFHQEITTRPDYRPHTSLSDMLKESSQSSEKLEELVKENALKEEFKFQQEHTAKPESNVTKVNAYKRFGLDYEVNEDFEQEIDQCPCFHGEFLKRVRDYKNVTIERMAEMTKISKTYIRNIEANEFSKLPADVYTRGFVYQYAKCLKLNPDHVATSYIQHLRELKNPS